MSTELATVLVVDDETRALETLERVLMDEFEVLVAESAETALAMLDDHNVEVILCDQRMPGMTGVSFLSKVREKWPEIIRVIISGYTDSDSIINAINDAGIYQYITKPWHPEPLILTVRNSVRLYRLQQQNQRLAMEMRYVPGALQSRVDQQQERLRSQFHLDNILRTNESPMEQLCGEVTRIAPYDISVLITGESGTGKELLARAIHYNSRRHDQPFVMENCGALHDDLLSSELFGHKKGAFTGAITEHTGLFEQADGGTIFLDEIGDISTALQVKLLRVLQEQEIRPLGHNKPRQVNVRVIAATNRDLREEIRAGRFRADLYYRLAAVTLSAPPLRERRMDIPLLAERLLDGIAERFGHEPPAIAPEVMEYLCTHDWPGNVRELQNELQRLLVLSNGKLLTVAGLSGHICRPTAANDTALTGQGSLKDQVARFESAILLRTIERHQGNKSRASEALGLSRVGLRSKLERYGIHYRDEDEDTPSTDVDND